MNAKPHLTNLAESIRQRLRNLARTTGRPAGDLLQYYAMERFLYRLSKSPYADRFILKGALMLNILGGQLSRATKDIDFLGRTENNLKLISNVIKECLLMEVPKDGLEFDVASLKIRPIQLGSPEIGTAVTFDAKIGGAILKIQVDISFGSDVVPEALWVIYPQLLDFGSPEILGYTAESIIADKFEAMVSRNETNTRLKDFYDIWVLSEIREFEGQHLQKAITSTFQFFKTEIPKETALCLTAEFFERPDKLAQWKAFFGNAKISIELNLADAAKRIEDLLMPVCEQINNNQEFKAKWMPKNGWMKSHI